ncbi:MAG: TrkA family potassium uptake protein, partial [Flavobacteriales bacterium]|nr:TrkA family potassium uptake protein [Flavobacteriales bacterium]
EEETAERWAKKLCLTNVIDSFELSDDFSIIEVNIPKKFIGKTIEEIQLRRNYNILALTTIKKTEIKSVVGKTWNEDKVQGVASPDTLLEEKDILVIYGANADLRKFTNQ